MIAGEKKYVNITENSGRQIMNKANVVLLLTDYFESLPIVLQKPDVYSFIEAEGYDFLEYLTSRITDEDLEKAYKLVQSKDVV